MINTIQMIMAIHKKEFRVNEYVHAFEKSLNYIFGAIIAIGFVSLVWYISVYPDWMKKIPQVLSDIHNDPTEVLCVITAVLTTLPYYFYYVLKDNTYWNGYNGKKDNWGLLKIFIIYEICIVSFFYLLLQGDTDFSGSKLITSSIGIILTMIYIGILLYRRLKKRERIGYFIVVILLTFIFFVCLLVNSLYKLYDCRFENQNYGVAMLLILFFVNAAINTLFLHKSDSNEETGIIANRIKIIVPMLSVSVFTSSIMYCYCYCRYCGERLSALFIVALWITVYEIIISCIKCYDVKVKVIWCIISFMIFIIGMPMIINHYTDNSHFSQSSLNPLFDWFLIIGICIYLVGIKYFGYIARLLFKKQNAEKIISKIMSNTIWLRNSILGSMLFILVILVKTSKYFLVLGAIIFWALLMEYFVYQYAFNHSKRDNGETGGTVYTIGKIIEFLAVLSLLFSYMTEIILNGQEGESPLKDYQNITLMVITVFAILVVMGLGLYIFSKLDKGQLVKLPELSQKQVLREVWNRLRSMKILTNDVLSDKNVVNFWMAVLTWGIYIVISVFSLYYYNSEFLNKMYGIILVAVIIEVDWIFLSRNIFNYYMEKMRESMNVMKYKKTFMEEWKECVAGLKGFKESDAKQFQCGSFLRPIMFYFGAAYQHQYNILQNDEAYRNIAKAACSIELIHKSTVLVDDYIDGDDIRNGAESFHYQYPDQRVLILLENSMQAKAQMNFMKSRRVFLCDNDVILDNMHKLSKIIYYINFGYYRELSLTDYEHLNIKEVDEINFLETGYFFKESIGLGYSCFHKFQSTSDYQNLEKLGKAFGYFYQCINDLEAFSRKERYERYKGKLNNLGKKNIVLLTLYNHLSEEEKGNFNNYKYREMAKLYRRYYIEQEVLEKVKKTLNEIKSILTLLEPGNKQWVKEFRILFNYFLADRRWENTFEL